MKKAVDDSNCQRPSAIPGYDNKLQPISQQVPGVQEEQEAQTGGQG